MRDAKTHTMSKIVKTLSVGGYSVQVRSTSHPAGARPEYSIEVYYLRDHFGMEPYQAQVGYHEKTLPTKVKALKVAKSIANGVLEYKGFMGGGYTTIPKHQ